MLQELMSRFNVPQALERRLRHHSSATITANPLITSAAPIHGDHAEGLTSRSSSPTTKGQKPKYHQKPWAMRQPPLQRASRQKKIPKTVAGVLGGYRRLQESRRPEPHRMALLHLNQKVLRSPGRREDDPNYVRGHVSVQRIP